MSHINRLADGSTPVEGSSKNINGGLPIIAIETESFLLLPPDKLHALEFSNSIKSISAIYLEIN